MKQVQRSRLSLSVTVALSVFEEPEFALAAAVIAQAVYDLRRKDWKRDAASFLKSDGAKFICETLGIEHKRLLCLAGVISVSRSREGKGRAV